jgi:DNA-binding transcriptional ArsR family regulator
LAGLFSPVGAAEITSYKIISQVEGTSVEATVIVTILNDGQNEVSSASLSVPSHYSVKGIQDTYGDLEYEVTGTRIKDIAFTFSTPLRPSEDRVMTLEIRSDSLVSQKEGYYEYLLVFTPRSDIPDFEHVLKLPPGVQLYSPQESFEMVVPPANLSDAFDVPSLGWSMAVGANQPTVFLVRYKTDEKDMGLAGWFLVWAVAGAVMGGVAYLAGRRMRERLRMKRVIESLKILNERERAVIEEVAKREGMKQTELLERLGYTKASLSKILTKLEQRDLVRKEKHGKINRLYLGEKVK